MSPLEREEFIDLLKGGRVRPASPGDLSLKSCPKEEEISFKKSKLELPWSLLLVPDVCSRTGKAFMLQSKTTFTGVKCTKRLFLLLCISNLEGSEESKNPGMQQGKCVAPIPAFLGRNKK